VFADDGEEDEILVGGDEPEGFQDEVFCDELDTGTRDNNDIIRGGCKLELV
jgi:hypothetical protein